MSQEISDDSKPQRLTWIDVVKGGSIFFVVFFHASIAAESYFDLSSKLWQINNAISPMRMPVFFLVSGYLARSALRRPWPKLLKAKTATFLYLVLIWLLIAFLFDVTFFDKSANIFDFLLQGIVINPTSTLWFLLALAIYFPLAKLSMRIRPLAAMIALALYTSVSVGYIAFDSYVHDNILKYFIFFFIAAAYGETIFGWMGNNRWIGPVSTVIFAGLTAAHLKSDPSGATGKILQTVLPFFGIGFGYFASAIIAKISPLRRFWTYLGRNTLSIYLAHSLVMRVLAASVGIRGDDIGLATSLCLVLALSTVGIAVSLALKWCADRIGVDWLYRLPNNKPSLRVTA
ncbi:acyltransferase family protein [Salipiger abyssi]|uniref:acyltransferase family protein n=1 Tax=Salipiger abyssi TaxID=1250539 RepID=UPI001A90BE4D|nr:acyltransferase family protein [Salipiger abyssi]MBN9886765.1 acyltransferase family protein [Salipiger abyssi]